MKKYTPDELAVLTIKVSECFYSWNQVASFGRRVVTPIHNGQEPIVEDELRANYYRDKFFHEISELYTYFYHHQDKTILDSFSASEEERKRLRDMRHPIAHVDGDINKIFKAQEDFLKNLPSNTNQINDLILIIRHTRFLLRFIQGEHHLIERLKAILRIYPQGLISPGIQKEILE